MNTLALSTNNKETFLLINFVQLFEGIIASVKYIKKNLILRYCFYCLGNCKQKLALYRRKYEHKFLCARSHQRVFWISCKLSLDCLFKYRFTDLYFATILGDNLWIDDFLMQHSRHKSFLYNHILYILWKRMNSFITH